MAYYVAGVTKCGFYFERRFPTSRAARSFADSVLLRVRGYRIERRGVFRPRLVLAATSLVLAFSMALPCLAFATDSELAGKGVMSWDIGGSALDGVEFRHGQIDDELRDWISERDSGLTPVIQFETDDNYNFTIVGCVPLNSSDFYPARLLLFANYDPCFWLSTQEALPFQCDMYICPRLSDGSHDRKGLMLDGTVPISDFNQYMDNWGVRGQVITLSDDVPVYEMETDFYGFVSYSMQSGYVFDGRGQLLYSPAGNSGGGTVNVDLSGVVDAVRSYANVVNPQVTGDFFFVFLVDSVLLVLILGALAFLSFRPGR